MSNTIERDKAFDEMMDDCYQPWTMGAYTFYPSDILYECDPIMYYEAVCEYYDSQCKDGQHTPKDDGTCEWCSEPMDDDNRKVFVTLQLP